MKDVRDRIAGALYGVAVGDALGAPLEFMNKEEILRKHGLVTEMIGGGWLKVVPGEVTDDTQMTLCVARGICRNPDNPVPEIGKEFIAWYAGRPKDVGATINMAIQNKLVGEIEWIDAARLTHEQMGGKSAGNGALMRTVYPGLYYTDTTVAIKTAGAIAQMTHWDKKSTEACILYTEMINLIIESVNKEQALQIIRGVLQGSEYSLKIRKQLNPTGYVVDSFNCALHSIAATGTFEEAIIEAANLGGDADTIAAITGGLAGAIYGYREIPERWIQALDPKIRKQLDRLVDAAVKNREASC